jgi:hypothetical protein
VVGPTFGVRFSGRRTAIRLGAVRLERLAPLGRRSSSAPGRLSRQGAICDTAVIGCSLRNQSGRPAAATGRAFGSVGVVAARVTRRVDGRHLGSIAGPLLILLASRKSHGIRRGCWNRGDWLDWGRTEAP